MEPKAPSAAIKDVERQIRIILRPVDVLKLNKKVRDILFLLQQSLGEAKSYATDYELSETRQEQLGNAKQAKKYLSKAATHILTASTEDVFGAVDVAHLTAVLDQVKADLR